MHKAHKTKLKTELLKGISYVSSLLPGTTNIMDCDHSLHAVKWHINCTSVDVARQYEEHLQQHYGSNVVAVVGGYENVPNIKDHEHQR